VTFLSPAFLWALPLAAAPLVLHLLSRRRAKRVRFSDLSLLRRVRARALPRTRLQQWLLVAARCLLLLLLILAYAGPVLQARGGAQAGKGETLDLAVLVDESYSMLAREAGKTRFELARAQLEGLLRTLKSSDRVALIPFSDRVELPAAEINWRSPRQALDALPRLAAGFRTTDYGPAVRAAAELFARGESKGRRAALLLGDSARHGARGPLPPLPAGVPLLGLEWAAPPANAWLVSAGPARDSDARRPRLLARAANVAGASAVELLEDGRRLEGAALRAAPDQTVQLPLPAPPPGAPAEWSGQAALRADALPADDAYFYSFSLPERPRLLCLYGDPAFFKAPNAGYFLKQLLGGEKDSLLPFEAEYLELARLEEARLSDYKIVVVIDAASVPREAEAKLDSFVRGGGGLLVVPGSKAGGEALAPLSALLPAQIGPLVEGEGGGIRPGPAADARAWRDYELDKVNLMRYHLLQLRPGSQAVFRSASGYPLLAVGKRGRGRAALWAATFDATWTNLPLKPPFAPFVQAALDAVSQPGSRGTETRDLKVGQAIRRVWEESEPAPGSVRLRGPDGRSETLWLRGRAVEYAGAEKPGLYALTEEGSSRRRVYAVNLDRATGESDLSPLPSPPWKPLRADDLAAQFALKVYGRDARSAALAGAAALLVLEMLLALPRSAAAALLVLLLAGAPARAQHGDRFVWTQLKLGEGFDPYPTAWSEILQQFGTVTSVLTFPDRRVISPADPELYFSPLVVLAGRQAPPELSEEDARRLRNYLTAGGLLWIEDASGLTESSFDRWVRRSLPRILPESELAPLPADHVVYRTFFLLRGPAGRVMVRGSLEGVSWAGRTAVIYSRNDILGAWPKDALGQPVYPCAPGGEAQRHNARKLALNILMYALTGSYKADAVHQPYLLQKMRSGVP
jgi:hypothetical protein